MVVPSSNQAIRDYYRGCGRARTGRCPPTVTPRPAEIIQMAATAHVFARYLARPGQEEAVKAVLTALIAPTRRELGCYQCDLLENRIDPRELCFVERWESDKAFDEHLEMSYVKSATAQLADLLETPLDIRRYHIV